MKRRKRHIAPQYEFRFAPDTFNLFAESTLDGERLAREREALDRARRQAADAQPSLFPLATPDTRKP
jgi:hypothetical protein